MKNKLYKKQREKGTIRVGEIMFIVTGDEYAKYYAELERKKYIRREERGRNIPYELAISDGLPIDILSATSPTLVEDEAEKNILIELMLQAIAKLGKSDKKLIKWLYYDEMTTRQIAELLCVNQSTIVRRHAFIIKKIKKILRI